MSNMEPNGNGNGNGYKTAANLAELMADYRNLKERFLYETAILRSEIESLKKGAAANQNKVIGALGTSVITLVGIVLKQLGVY